MADKKEETAAPEAEGEEVAEKKGGNLGLVIGIIVGIVLIQGALAYLLIPKPVDEAAIRQKAEEDSIKAAIEAETRMGAVTEPIEAVVNVAAGTENERILKAVIILEFEENKKGTFGPELLNRSPRYKDMLIKHLSSLSAKEITDPMAKDNISKEMLRQINASLPPGHGEVSNVLFTTYIIQ